MKRVKKILVQRSLVNNQVQVSEGANRTSKRVIGKQRERKLLFLAGGEGGAIVRNLGECWVFQIVCQMGLFGDDVKTFLEET